MPIPEFVLELRRHVGHSQLWLMGVTAVVVRGGAEVLLVQRSDTHVWTPVTGIVDPGEHPALTAVREVEEEAGVVATVRRLAAVTVGRAIVHANGDQAQYLDLVFRFRYVAGEPHPADGENTAAGWFPLSALPPVSEQMLERIRRALVPLGDSDFEVTAR